LHNRYAQRYQELARRFNRGQISRRDFLRSAALLGLTLGAGEFLSACRPSPATGQPFDPIETIYGIDYITTTPEGGGQPMGAASGTQAVPSGASEPRQIEWYCGCCGGRFRTVEDLKKHAAAEHGWRLPEIQRVDQPTYDQFLQGVERFDEKNTVFSRTGWDEEYQALVQEYQVKAPEDDWDRVEGRALTAGAIYADATAGTLHPNYYGYFGHVRGAGGLYDWDDPVSPVQYPVSDPAWMTERIKEVARFYGANLVGVAAVDERWIYSNYYERVTGEYGKNDIPYKYAVVMGIEMEWSHITLSPGPEASAATALIYSRMAELSASLAKYIRSLGYAAIPCGNDSAQSIPLAIDAGLGELGRSGLLLSPEYGSRQRICKVFTDLPLVPDKPVDFGIQSFCETCHACAAACPVDAIRWDERTTEQTSISNRPGILRWPVNVGRCYLFWQENGMDCSNCIAACPWSLHSQRDWLEL
jgi:NAD-dependent dihydropyrimidine dehydrogenase PreA subunit